MKDKLTKQELEKEIVKHQTWCVIKDCDYIQRLKQQLKRLK